MIASIHGILLPWGTPISPFKWNCLPLNTQKKRNILSSSPHLLSVQGLNKKKHVWIIEVSCTLTKWGIVPLCGARTILHCMRWTAFSSWRFMILSYDFLSAHCILGNKNKTADRQNSVNEKLCRWQKSLALRGGQQFQFALLICAPVGEYPDKV